MATPAVASLGFWPKTSFAAAAGLTVMPAWLPVMAVVAVSVAVIDCVPAVLSVAVKLPVPPVSLVLAGRDAWPSLLVNLTLPL